MTSFADLHQIGDPLVLPDQRAALLESFTFETDGFGQMITRIDELHHTPGAPSHNDWLL